MLFHYISWDISTSLYTNMMFLIKEQDIEVGNHSVKPGKIFKILLCSRDI